MKKKIFLITAMVALLVCVFAISVSAANEVTLVNGDKVDFETVFNVGKVDGVDNVVTGFKTGYDSNSMTDVIFPDYIAGIKYNGLFGKYANSASTTIKTLTFETSDELFIHGVNMFTGCSVEKVTFNPNCVVEIRDGNFSGCTSLTEITFPKFLKLASGTFSGCTNMVPTNELVFAEGMTEIAANAFNQCSRLTGTVVFPSTLKSIGEAAFKASGITGVDFSKCASLDTLVKSIFVNCDSLTAIDMSACVSLTSLSNSFAENCDNLASVVLPPNLETINEKSFAWCGKLQSMVIPASCTLIGVEAFQFARRGQELQVFTLYIQGNVNFDTSRYSVFNSSSAKVEFVLIGENVTAESFIAANTYSHVTGATIVDYVAGENPWTYVPGQTISSHTIVTNYCRALALMGEHNSEDNPCVINCSVCGKKSLKENPVHSLVTNVEYANGFAAKGQKAVVCTSEGCGYTEISEMPALFTNLGFSAAEYSGGGMSIGFKVDKDAILAYEEATGETVSYGVFAALAEKIGANDIFGADGKALDGVIAADITGTGFDIFNLKIVGITDEQDDIDLVMGAYVGTTKDGKTEYAYLQGGTPETGAKYFFASYTDVKAIVDAKNGVSAQ